MDEQSTSYIFLKKAGLDLMQSHTLHRVNTKSYQLCWGVWKMGNGVSCKEET